MFRSYFVSVANDIKQWYHWFVVSGAQQYGNYHLYLYPNSRAVCNDDNAYYYSQSEYYADVYCGGADLFGSRFVGVANDFYKWHYRFMVSGFG